MLANKWNFLSVHVLLLICIAANATAQGTADEKIIPGGKLQWSDYTGKADTSSGYWATTNCFEHYKYLITKTKGDTVFAAVFAWAALEGNSWVIADKESDELLQHEQGHFDLAKLIAARFIKEADTIVLLLANYDQKLKALFNSIHNEVAQMEIQYDAETQHMWNREAQNNWNKKISGMLQAVK